MREINNFILKVIVIIKLMRVNFIKGCNYYFQYFFGCYGEIKNR